MPDFPADEARATEALYYLTGIETGVLAGDSAKEWAFAIVEALDEPPIEIIEVATAKDRLAAMAALRSVRGDPDYGFAAGRLMAQLGAQLQDGSISAMQSVRAARRICLSTRLQDAEMQFMAFEEDLQLALDGMYGSPEHLRLELIELLKQRARSD